jgi:hypothetical protein
MISVKRFVIGANEAVPRLSKTSQRRPAALGPVVNPRFVCLALAYGRCEAAKPFSLVDSLRKPDCDRVFLFEVEVRCIYDEQ